MTDGLERDRRLHRRPQSTPVLVRLLLLVASASTTLAVGAAMFMSTYPKPQDVRVLPTIDVYAFPGSAAAPGGIGADSAHPLLVRVHITMDPGAGRVDLEIDAEPSGFEPEPQRVRWAAAVTGLAPPPGFDPLGDPDGTWVVWSGHTEDPEPLGREVELLPQERRRQAEITMCRRTSPGELCFGTLRGLRFSRGPVADEGNYKRIALPVVTTGGEHEVPLERQMDAAVGLTLLGQVRRLEVVEDVLTTDSDVLERAEPAATSIAGGLRLAGEAQFYPSLLLRDVDGERGAQRRTFVAGGLVGVAVSLFAVALDRLVGHLLSSPTSVPPPHGPGSVM